MGPTEWACQARKRVATGVGRDKGNSARLRLVGTRTHNSGIVMISHPAVR